MSAFLVLLTAFILWGGLHSLLASQKTKDWIQHLSPLAGRYYRLFYNFLALVTFLPIMALVDILPDQKIYQLRAPWLDVALVLQALGLALLVIGALQTDIWAFLGLRQILTKKEPESRFVVHGLYRLVRHPLYTAGLLFIWATPLMTRNVLIFNSLTTIYILIGIRFEERKLQREFGEAYRHYQMHTPMLLPRLPWHVKKG